MRDLRFGSRDYPQVENQQFQGELEKRLFERSINSYRLDGDNIRFGLNKNLGFSPEDREENIRRISEVSKLFADSCVIAITAFISPYRSDRQKARESHLKDGIKFIEVFVDCPLEIVEARDPKGLYKKARAGEIKQFTGVDAPYEKPEHPEITIKTNEYNVTQCVDHIIKHLDDHSLIKAVDHHHHHVNNKLHN